MCILTPSCTTTCVITVTVATARQAETKLVQRELCVAAVFQSRAVAELDHTLTSVWSRLGHAPDPPPHPPDPHHHPTISPMCEHLVYVLFAMFLLFIFHVNQTEVNSICRLRGCEFIWTESGNTIRIAIQVRQYSVLRYAAIRKEGTTMY